MTQPAPQFIPRAGVIGWPVAQSLSPRLHGFWLRQYGIRGCYDAIPAAPADLAETLRNLRDRHFTGVNLTAPHKQAALALMDRCDPLALQAGAVNTVVVGPDGQLTGRNTDIGGCVENLREGGYVADGRPAVVLGAGGAARAAVLALGQLGCTDMRIVNRSPDHAATLAPAFPNTELRVFSWQDATALAGAGLLINATSLGMTGQPALAIDLAPLPPDAMVADLVYAPLQTGLLQAAVRRGHRTIDGLGMLLHQARPAFQAFFGTDPAVTPELRAHLLEAV